VAVGEPTTPWLSVDIEASVSSAVLRLMTVDQKYTRVLSVRGRERGRREGGGDVQDESSALIWWLGGCYRPGFWCGANTH
jgi:hypothetical protein